MEAYRALKARDEPGETSWLTKDLGSDGSWVGFYRHRWEQLAGQVDEFRARGKELGDWSDWCFLRPHIRRAHWHSLWVGKRDQADARSVT